MMVLGEGADIKDWYHFLTESCGLEIGRDWCWAWQDNCWAIEFQDPRDETRARLKMGYDS